MLCRGIFKLPSLYTLISVFTFCKHKVKRSEFIEFSRSVPMMAKIVIYKLEELLKAIRLVTACTRLRSFTIKLVYLLLSTIAIAGCAVNQYLTMASEPRMVSGEYIVDTLRKCLSDKRLGDAENFNLCEIKTAGDGLSILLVSIFNKSGGLTQTFGTRLTEFSAVSRERMRSREVVELLDLALTHSTEATLILLGESLVCSRLPEVARSDAGALVLDYAAERGLCSDLEIQRAFFLAYSDEVAKGIKASLSSPCLSNSKQASVENATLRLLERLMANGDFETTSLALRTIASSKETSDTCQMETAIASFRSSPNRMLPMVARQDSQFSGKYTTSGSLNELAYFLSSGSPSISRVRALFLHDPSAFASNIDDICALIGGVKPIDEAAASNRNIYLRTFQPGCYALSASVPLTLVGADEAESAAGTIIILRRGSFKLVETSKSGAIVVAPKFRNAAAAPRIYGFPVYFYVNESNKRPKEVFAFHWVSELPRREDGAYFQADVNLTQQEPLVYVDHSTAAIASLLSEDDMSEIRLDYAGPALGISFSGIYGTPLRILQSTRVVCSRIRSARAQGFSVTVPANWDEALTPGDRIDRAKFCGIGNAAQCFAQVISDLGCTDDEAKNSPLPSVLNANVTKFRLENVR